MKAKDLARLLDGVNPDANVYIDLGVSHDKTKALIYEMLTNPDSGACHVEHITMTVFDDGVKEVYLCPYDGQYDLTDDKTAECFFEEHELDEVMERARDIYRHEP